MLRSAKRSGFSQPLHRIFTAMHEMLMAVGTILPQPIALRLVLSQEFYHRRKFYETFVVRTPVQGRL